jgi:very-short-patch-repair endonuclease
MTPPERRLWAYLRTEPDGFQFRKQRPCGPFTLDFFCRRAGLAIEVDGMAHDMGDNPVRDARRDAWIRRQGIELLRIPAIELKDNLDGAAALILDRCASRSPPPSCGRSPSPRKRGEEK